MKSNYILCSKCMYSNMLHNQLSVNENAPKVCENCYSFNEDKNNKNHSKKLLK